MSQKGQFTVTGFTEVKSLTGDVGTPATPLLSNIDILGDGRNIETTSDAAAHTVTVALHGTGDHCVQVGNIAGNLSDIAIGTNGQLLVGTTGADPVFASLGVGNGIDKVEGAGTLSIAGIDAGEAQVGVVELATDAETIAGAATVPVNTAIRPTALKAKLGVQTDHGLPIGAGDTAAIAWTAEPTDGQLLIGETGAAPSLATLTAGTNIGITNAAHSITIKINGTTDHAIQLGNATGELNSLAVGATGQLLLGSTAADPMWTAAMTDGQLIIGSTGNDPALATLTAGANIGITGGAGSITIKVNGTTDHAVQIGNATGDLDSLAVGANGETLMGSTGANPGWTSSPQFGGSITATNDITSTAGSINSLAGSFITRDATNTATGPSIYFQKTRVAAIITSGDELGTMRFTGYDGVGYITGAKITSTNAGTPGVNQIDGDLKFYTHPDSAIALPSEPLLRMTINNAGNVTIASPDAGTALTITAGGLTVTAGNISAAAGSVGASTTVTAGTDLVSTAGNLLLPTTTAAVGQVQFNSVNCLHTYGNSNIFVGALAGNTTFNTGQNANNAAVGYNALHSLVGTNAGEGYYCSALGYNAGAALTTGDKQTFVGALAGYYATTGTYNTFLGYSTGYYSVTPSGLTVGSYNTLLGARAGYSYTNDEGSNICIGYAASGTAGEDNVLRIGSGTGTGNGQLNSAYISGISSYSTVTADTKIVTIDTSTNQMGLCDFSGLKYTPYASASLNPMVANNCYMGSYSVGQQVFTLPATAAVGEVFSFIGNGNTNGIRIRTKTVTTQKIHSNGTVMPVTAGKYGYIQTTSAYGSIELVCVAADTKFVVRFLNGTWSMNEA